MIVIIMNKLKMLRKKYGYSAVDISKLVGISQSYYSQIENGKKRIFYSLACKIAKIYGLKPDDIFYEL